MRRVADEAAIAMALIENIQRENLNPLEEARALDRLITEFDMTHATAAEAVGRSRAAVSNLLRLLELTDEVKTLVEHRELEMGHARALLGLETNRQQAEVGALVAKKKLSVRETEALVKRLTAKPQAAAAGERAARRCEHSQARKRAERKVGCEGRRATHDLGQGQTRHQLPHARRARRYSRPYTLTAWDDQPCCPVHGGWNFLRRVSLLCFAAALPAHAEIVVDGRIDESEWENAIRCDDWRRTRAVRA